ncbi:MAG: response regulator transcription factor [Pseudomonadota bacterium]|nr:response regulator transcription factor [Pseudomonadota bacterium]
MTGSSNPSILLVEDDDQLAPLVVRHLTDSGFAVAWVGDGEAAWRRLSEGGVALIVLDVMLPGEDGLSLCRRLRRQFDVAIIMVTARGQESDRILGLDLGADDYVPKPFSLWELEARIKAVLRRYGRSTSAASAAFATGPLTLDPRHRTALLDGRRVDLTRSEFDMLAMLAREPGRVFSREQMLECVRGGDTEAFDRAVDTHVSNLRRKIERDPKSPTLLKTVWGIGYRFEAP